MSNRQLEERVEQGHSEMLAAELGITVDELQLLKYEESTIESDDGLPHFILIEFREGSPRAILDKIDDLQDGDFVRLDINAFDRLDRDDEDNFKNE